MATQTLFATAAGAGQALTVNYAAGAWNPATPGAGAGVVRVANPCDIIARATIGGTAADRIELQVQVSSLGDADWFELPFARDNGEFLEYLSKPIAIPGAAATVPVFFHVPGGWHDNSMGGDIRIRARRVGGAADTTLFIEGEIRDNRDSPSLAGFLGGGGVAGAGSGYAGASFEIRAAAIVTGAYVYGTEFDAGDADLLLLHVAKTLGNNPTNVDFDIQCSDDAGTTWESLPQIDQVAAGVTVEQGMTLRTTEIGAAVGNFLYSVEIYPHLRYRVGVLFTGGTAPTLAIDAQLIKR